MRKLKLEELNRPSLEAYKSTDKHPIIVVLDNIRSAHNVGSIFRTCDALGIEHLDLCGITARPPHKEITKAAIGATHSVSWEYHENVETLITTYQKKGYKIVGVEQTTESVSLLDFSLKSHSSEKWIIVFGNEVEGISDALLPLLDTAIEIPQYGTKHSFNVSVCAGVVLWELVRQLKSN